MKQKSEKTRWRIFVGIVVIGIALCTIVICYMNQGNAASYQQAVNEEGIAVDLSENPYYDQKQPGFHYRQAETISYHSDVTNTTRHAKIFLPADYDKNQSYPVLYLLHGMGGSHNTWENKDADVILQNLYYFQNATEMIVVCPNSNVNKDEETDEEDLEGLVEAFDDTEPDLVNDLMPYIEKHYAVKKGKENTAIAGNSMGGRNALAIAFHHQDLFGSIGVFSAADVVKEIDPDSIIPPLIDTLEVDQRYGDFHLIMIAVGTSDDVCGYVSYDLDTYLDAKQIDHIFYDMEGGHENLVWKNALYNFAIRLFQNED